MISRTICTILLALLLAGPAIAEESVLRLSEPVSATEDYEDFGAELPAADQVHSLSEALASRTSVAPSQ